jgi:squalene-hopene/tetraprenyl-beta-curcumene cyclase
VVADPAVLDLARDTLNRARHHALGLQHAQGWWQGELETNVTMDAEDLLLREFLGLHDDETIAAAARWIRYQQRDDGTCPPRSRPTWRCAWPATSRTLRT